MLPFIFTLRETHAMVRLGHISREAYLHSDSQRACVRLSQVVLSFYESRRKQPWALGFGAQEERLFWEQWCVTSSSDGCHLHRFAMQEPVLPGLNTA